MATNKHAIIRYQALDRCFRNTARKYYAEDLINTCNKAIYNLPEQILELVGGRFLKI